MASYDRIWFVLSSLVFFISSLFLLAFFFLIFIISAFYKPLQELLFPLILLIVFTFFWETYGNTALFSEVILTNPFLWIGINLLLLLLSPLLLLTFLLLLTLHFSSLAASYLPYMIGNVSLICVVQIYFFS